MNTELTLTKSTVECYKIRSSKNSNWADITIDSNGSTGRIQIASDYGDWQRYWGACGSSFKEFLTKLNIEYAADKFGADNYFDLDKTINSLKSQIEEFCESESADIKQELLNELKILEKESSCKEEFVHKMWDSPKLLEMTDNSPDLCMSITPLFKRFWDEMWPTFIQELKNEIQVPA